MIIILSFLLCTFLSCGFVYYLINAIIAFVGIVAHTCCLAVPVSREREMNLTTSIAMLKSSMPILKMKAVMAMITKMTAHYQ